MEIDSKDQSGDLHGQITFTSNNLGRQWYRYTSVPIEAARASISEAAATATKQCQSASRFQIVVFFFSLEIDSEKFNS
jgi:hypothetical protein